MAKKRAKVKKSRKTHKVPIYRMVDLNPDNLSTEEREILGLPVDEEEYVHVEGEDYYLSDFFDPSFDD